MAMHEAYFLTTTSTSTTSNSEKAHLYTTHPFDHKSSFMLFAMRGCGSLRIRRHNRIEKHVHLE